MTTTTHQLFALLLAFWLLTVSPVMVGPLVGAAAVVAVMIGAITPDLDQPAATIWRRVLGARTLGTIFQKFSGGHRHLTHSFVGIGLIGFLTHYAITHWLTSAIVPAALVIWFAYMVGYISHPIADSLTDWGVPWFWPLPLHIKVPPGPEELRVTTGTWVELLLVRGGILAAGIFLLSGHWPTLVAFFT